MPQKNGQQHIIAPHGNQRAADRILYEHGAAIADLAARTTSLEEWRREMRDILKTLAEDTQANTEALAKLVNRAWGVKKTLIVGGVIFTTAGGAVISLALWVANLTGATIVFGG